MSMLSSHPKAGYKRHSLTVRSEDVNLTSSQFQSFKESQKKWRTQDHFTNPGPIQFNFEATHDSNIAESLNLSYQEVNDLTAEISGLCHSIQNDALFTEHKHLLLAALSSLKSAKMVINSFSNAKLQ